jgi:two-component system, cell cycle response regulator DivK
MSQFEDWLILVVEDELDGQEVVAGILGYMNIACEAVTTAEEALKRLNQRVYTGVVIDLALPGMNGWSLLEGIRTNPRTAMLPCVAITAFHSSGVRKEAIEAGFSAYFPKPLEDTAFLRELTRVIQERLTSPGGSI